MKSMSRFVAEALEELRKVITKFTSQIPRTHRSEDDDVEYFHDAVLEAECDFDV